MKKGLVKNSLFLVAHHRLMPLGIEMEATAQSYAVAIHATLLEIEKVTEEFKM